MGGLDRAKPTRGITCLRAGCIIVLLQSVVWAQGLNGDTDLSGTVETADRDLVVDHILERSFLEGEALANADVNSDGDIDAADLTFYLSLLDTSSTKLVSSSPSNGDGNVAVTRETILRFDGPLMAESVSSDAIFATFGGETLPTRLHVSPDATTVTMFEAMVTIVPVTACEPLPQPPVAWGLAVNRSGRVLVTLADGSAVGLW